MRERRVRQELDGVALPSPHYAKLPIGLCWEKVRKFLAMLLVISL